MSDAFIYLSFTQCFTVGISKVMACVDAVCLMTIHLTTDSIHLRLYSVVHVVKDDSDSERGNLLESLHGLLFSVSSKGCFIYTIPQMIAHNLV